jgi:hypothetical protein
MLCVRLGQRRDEAARHWALMQAELIGAAEEPNVSVYNLCRAAEIEARMEAASHSILPAPESAFGCIVGLSEDWCAT